MLDILWPMRKYLEEVEEKLNSIKPGKRVSSWKIADYIGAGRSSLRFLDVKIPDVRNVFRDGFSFYNRKDKTFKPEHLKIFDFIWNHSKSFEALLICHYYVRSLPFSIRKENRELILDWLGRVDNWALSDELSSTFSEFLEDDPSLLKRYEKWNRSKNSWERRQSIVGMLFYVRFRKTKFLKWNQIRKLIEPLLNDEDYYVQKGVGWTLREAYTWYPEPVFDYIVNTCTRIHPVAWYATTERMSEKEKRILKAKRKFRKVSRS